MISCDTCCEQGGGVQKADAAGSVVHDRGSGQEGRCLLRAT